MNIEKMTGLEIWLQIVALLFLYEVENRYLC